MRIEERFSELIDSLKERGFRLTPQRVELVRLIAASEGHPSAGQIYERIHAQFPTISQATVYKTLVLLKDLNQVYEVDLHEDSHYDGYRPEPHPHLICTRCHKILDGEFEINKKTLEAVEKATGFSITQQRIELFGLCAECRAQ